jgi:hypothetical protein
VKDRDFLLRVKSWQNKPDCGATSVLRLAAGRSGFHPVLELNLKELQIESPS